MFDMTQFSKRWSDPALVATCDVMDRLFQPMTAADGIAFSIGSPAVEALPVDALREISQDVFRRDGRGIEALAYGTKMGIRDLREIIASELLAPKGVHTSADNILITAGGLETMKLLCDIFLDPGDVILVESPTFVHCVMIFQIFNAVCIPCQMDNDGLIMEDVEAKIQKYHPKMIYTVPTFQNPTGVTLSQDRRQKLAELAAKYDVIVIEDDPYRDIRFQGKDLLPIKTFDEAGKVVLANSFSKIFSPGSRLGYVVAPDDIMDKIAYAKVATNSHSSKISEVLAAEFFKRGYFPNHLKRICAIYRERCAAMMKALDAYFPEGTKHTYPDGGLFTWAELPGDIDTTELLKETMDKLHISFVAGRGFYVEGGDAGKNCMRISFGAVPPDKIYTGIKRLGDYIKTKL